MLLQSLVGAAALAAATIPATQIPAAMVSTVTSATAKVGESFTFQTTQGARIGDLSIPAATRGQGIVVAVSPAAGTHRGTLSLAPQFLMLADGRHIPVTAASPMAYAAPRHFFPFPLPLPGIVLVGGVQNPGGNVTIGPGTRFEIAVSPRVDTP